MSVAAVDEVRHPPGTEPGWSESWTFDFWSRDGSLGGWCRMVLIPNAGTAWYHAFLTGPERQLVAVIDTEVPLPPPPSLEIRTTGLWADHICETPHDHWTVGLEAFGVGVDDPAELYGRQFGDQVPLGFDLEWERTGPVDEMSDPTSTYHQPCRVSGEVLVGSEVIDLDGHGRRERHWGRRRDWEVRWFRFHGALEDGTGLTAAVVGDDLAAAAGSVDGAPVEVTAVSDATGADAMPEAARVDLDGLEVGVDPVAATPYEASDAEGRVTRAPRALCRLAAADGRTGSGWAEWNVPQSR